MYGYNKQLFNLARDPNERYAEAKWFIERADITYYEGGWDAFPEFVRAGHKSVVNLFIEKCLSYRADPFSKYLPVQLMCSCKQHRPLRWACNIEIVKLIGPYLITDFDSYKYQLQFKSDEIKEYLKVVGVPSFSR